MSSRGPAARRLGGLMLIGFGALLALVVGIALIITDFRVAAMVPVEQRSEVLEQAVKNSLAWACGSGVVVSLGGVMLWLTGRAR